MNEKYTAICDMCGKRKMRSEFFSIPDQKRGRGFCKACAKDMYYDEDEELDYLLSTAHLFKPKTKPKLKELPNPTPPPEQIKLF